MKIWSTSSPIAATNENMENERKTHEHHQAEKKQNGYMLPASILVSSIVLAGAWIYTSGLQYEKADPELKARTAASKLEEKIIPSSGVMLPVRWNDMGKRMVESGVIDYRKMNEVYASRGGMSAEMKALLEKDDNGQLVITRENSGELLNLFWALGLGNKNTILEKGPMQNPQYGGAGRFASTGEWTIASGDAMNHYSAHQFINLTPEQQALVDKVSRNIYRPCCGNSVYFPDCNHGMAMLGLLELMASQGATENQMYNIALSVNSYWFPDTYMTIAKYLQGKGLEWETVNPKSVLGANFSGSRGYAQIQSLVAPEPSSQSQGGCGVDTGEPARAVQQQRQQGGCDL